MDGLKARLSFDAVAYDYDDEYLTIDTDTHTININNVSRLFGVQYDGNSKLIKFKIRNKLSDIQKMQDSIVYINWIDSRGVKGQSIAINKTIDNDTCEFAWKVPFDALKNSGVLHFAMSAVVTKNSSSVIDQRWSTQIASVITPDGIYIKSYTPSSEEEDRIAQIYNELSNMINKQNDNLSDMQSQVNLLNEDLENVADYTVQRIGVRLGTMYSTGVEAYETNRCKTFPVSCKKVKTFKIVKPSTIDQTLYMVYKNGAWSTNEYKGYTLIGNMLSITDLEIEEILIVFKNKTNSDITAEELTTTYLVPYIDVYERLDSAESNISVIDKRVEYSTARYQTAIGKFNIRNEELEDTAYMRTPEIDSRNVKQFKQFVSLGCKVYSAIFKVGGNWVDGEYYDTDGIVTIDSNVDMFRVIYNRIDGLDITATDLKNTFILPYIDVVKKLDDVTEQINNAGTVVNRTDITFVNTGESSDRFVHNARRSGNGKVPVWTIIDDDGRADALNVWLPMLQHNDFTMTIPLITSMIGIDKNYLTWDNVKTLSDAGVEICSHTHTHPSLIDISEDEMRTEFAVSIRTLAEHGYYNRHLAYPQNKHNEIVRRIASEYFDCAVAYAEGTIIENVPPVKTYRLSRQEIGKENQTLDSYKAMIDSCIVNKSWLITMSHSQSAYMHNPDLIEKAIQYAIKQGVKVVSLGEGLKMFGNIVECGVDTDGVNYTGIGADGNPFGQLRKMIVEDPPSNFDGKNIFDCFPKMTRVTMPITSENGSKYGFPNGSSGGTLDILVYSGNYYSYMDFHPLGTTKTYHREYSNGWGEWVSQGQFESVKIGSTIVTENQIKSLIALIS